MNVFLMHADRDFDPQAPLPSQAEDLVSDLGLDVLFDAMAGGDQFVRDVARRAILRSLTDPGEVTYRQEVLQDCLSHPAMARRLYQLAVDAIASERRIHGFYFFAKSPDLILSRSVQMMEMLVDALMQLRDIAAEGEEFRSRGLRRLFGMLLEELGAEYFRTVLGYLADLRLQGGILLSARIGLGGKGEDYVMHAPPPEERSFLRRFLGMGGRTYRIEISDRDEAGHQALAELRGRAINEVANALAQSAEHVLGFLGMLRAELGFYVGALNLHQALAAKGEPVCMPAACEAGSGRLATAGLYDVPLSLTLQGRAVGNDLSADHKTLVVITGANQGGKSTFLRSVGVAQLMLQAGMFVGAESFAADICSVILTHFPRPEDAALERGRLDEELGRMRRAVDLQSRGGLLLCNESFSSTNEREGSEIARQIVKALIEAGVKVFFVTHYYDFAQGFQRDGQAGVLFLRADRGQDGKRTYRLREAGPLPTSYGEDLFREVFGS